MNHLRNCTRRSVRAAAASAMTAAVVAASLAGCQSPFASDEAFKEDHYSQSVLVRDLMRSGAISGLEQSPTINGGIHEMARVDATGPAPASAPAPQPATLDAVSVIGLPEAALDMPEPQVKLSLQDAVFRTVNHALAIKVNSYQPGISEAALIQAEAVFDPSVFGQSNWASTDEPANPSPTTTNGQAWTNQLGVRETLPTGATVSAFAQTIYHDLALAPGATNAINYQSALNLTIDQPLLRGFGSDYNQASIYLAQRDLRVSQADFKKTVIQTISSAEKAYQNLVLARTAVEINERLVIASRETYDIIYKRLGLDVTKESMGLVQTSLLQHEESLLTAQENYRNASDALKNIMNDPELPTRSNILINPIDRPTSAPFNYSSEECIVQALEQRPEMEEARLKLEQANIVVKVSKEDLLPHLDLVAGMQSNALDGSLERSFAHTISPANFIDWNAGVSLDFPLGNRAAESALVGNQLKQRQAIENMMQVADNVVADVKSNLHAVLSGYTDIQYLDRVRVAAADTIEGNIELTPIRPKDPADLNVKLQEQQALASAELALATAIVNYNIAVEQLEAAKGTLLEYDHIALDHPPLARPKNSFNDWFFNGQSVIPIPSTWTGGK